jgi:hypothetical protein
MMLTTSPLRNGHMQTLTIEVTQDHIDRLSKAKKPVLGVAELIWNSMDADATEVDVRLTRNGLNSIESIQVVDNGLGISMTDAQEGFGHLGGSWKQHQQQTKRDKRILHGKQGQGRFRAFALCDRVEWNSTYLRNGALTEFKIVGTTSDKRRFTISDEAPSTGVGTGTLATLSNVISQQASLDGGKAVPELNKLFALYLKQYPQVCVSYDGQLIDPKSLEKHRSTYTLPPFTTEDGQTYESKLTIIEWNIDIERGLYLCTEGGFTLRELPPGIHAPGYRFTAYLSSKLLEEMDEAGTIEMEEFTDLKKLLDVARVQMRRHFLQRDAEKAAGVVEQWKQEDIYPYDGEPKDVIEEAERQVFDVVAVNLDSYVEDFKESKPQSKKLTFTLLRYALESNPSSLNFILEQVVGLPKDKQDEFAALLQKTSLIAMINASKIVTDRLDFLKGLEYLLFDPNSRSELKERSQLHKLISRNTWIFGDEFYLVNNDESLTNVLRKHVKHVDFDIDLDTPVVREDGTEGVIDIGLSTSPPDSEEKDVVVSKILERQPSEGKHHLVIELKRPSQNINSEVIGQVRSYAFAVATDERFQNVRTNWTFWALSNKMSEQAVLEAQMENQPQGVVYQSKADARRNYNMTIWAKTWSEIIEECTARLKFFQDRLNYNASQSSGRKYLHETYPKFIPPKPEDEKL